MDAFALIAPLLRRLEPETAHRLTLWALAKGLAPRAAEPDDPILASQLWNLDFSNPIGLAAGFDKNAEASAPLFDLGFGFVEVGSVTPRPQAGNPTPRVFRLPAERAVINRMGFPNEGLEAVGRRLRARSGDGFAGPLGINLGKNRDSGDAAADYAEAAAALAGFADYLVINVSSPNTPGLRALQGRDELEDIVGRVRAALGDEPRAASLPLLVKVAPDLEAVDLDDIAAVALGGAVDGLIATNTTVSRPPGLRGAHAEEAGGLSGAPLFQASTRILEQLYRRTDGRVVLVGVGGVSSGAEAYDKIRAGASLVQLYTALVYRGPGLIAAIKRDLADCLRRDGFSNVSEAVGSGVTD